MSVTDPIGDMLARIRNAQARGKSKVAVPASRLRERVLEVLHSEGFIRGFATVKQDGTAKADIEIELKYFDGAPVIRELHRVSKPGRRVYASVATMPTVFNGLGISILSTPKGVMSDADARAQNVGGEVLCTVF
jgi:small subunit ribosomal protein S8